MTRFQFQVAKHFGIYLAEVLGMSLVIFCYLEGLSPSANGYESIEKFMLAYGIYQAIVFIFLSTIDDIKKDSTLMLIGLLKWCLLYRDTNNIKLKVAIIQKIDDQLDKNTMNDRDIKDFLHFIKSNIDVIPVEEFELELVRREHDLEYYQLQWRLSFLLRLFK